MLRDLPSLLLIVSFQFRLIEKRYIYIFVCVCVCVCERERESLWIGLPLTCLAGPSPSAWFVSILNSGVQKVPDGEM